MEERFLKYVKGELDENEMRELEAWLHEDAANAESFKKVLRLYRKMRKSVFREYMREERAWRNIERSGRRKRFIRMMLRAAAAAIFVFGMGVFLYRNIDSGISKEDILPSAFSEPVLFLSGGDTLSLGTCSPGDISDGIFIGAGKESMSICEDPRFREDTAYNELYVPQGRTYTLRLSDGSRVHLNADTRLKFPLHFGKNCRKVVLEGEAYFEVEKDSSRLFTVIAGKQRADVLGTEFNISAYPDSDMSTTSLLKGRLRLYAGKEVFMMQAGTRVETKGDSTVVSEIGTEMFSWRNGYFVFEDTPLGEIALRLSRWYGTDFRFRRRELEDLRFTGTVSMEKKLPFILDLLTELSSLRYRVIDARTIEFM